MSVILGVAAVPAWAQQRYDISVMTCAEVQAVLEKNGVAILGTPSKSVLGLSRYDRYVREQRFCSASEVLRRTGVQTRDLQFCPVNRCVASDIFVAN